MATRLRKEAYIIAENFLFTLEVLDNDFNVMLYILTYTFDFYQVSAYITPIFCKVQISAL